MFVLWASKKHIAVDSQFTGLLSKKWIDTLCPVLQLNLSKMPAQETFIYNNYNIVCPINIQVGIWLSHHLMHGIDGLLVNCK